MTKPSVEARTVEEIAEQIAGDAPLNDIYATRRLKAEILCALQSVEARALREAADAAKHVPLPDFYLVQASAVCVANWLRARATEKEARVPTYADVIAREIEAHTFKIGDDVETPVDAGAAGSQWLRGAVIKAGPATYTVQWVTGAVNRIQQGYKGVRRVEPRDILGPDDFKTEG